MKWKNKYFIPISIILLLVLIKKSSNKLKKIVKNQLIRGDDDFGSGAFGANRSGHTHQGIDIITNVGENIYSPISGKVTRFPSPYANETAWTGIEIVNDKYSVKIFYVKPIVSISKIVEPGEQIAIAQNIKLKYGQTMTNHAHLEVRDSKTQQLLNPTNLF